MKILREKIKGINPFDIFGLFGAKKLSYSFVDFKTDITNYFKNSEEKKIQKQILKEQKRKQREKEQREFDKKWGWFFDTPASSNNKRRKYRPGFGDWPDEYDYNDVMDDLESEGYAVDE